jgi:hypothetical protein
LITSNCVEDAVAVAVQFLIELDLAVIGHAVVVPVRLRLVGDPVAVAVQAHAQDDVDRVVLRVPVEVGERLADRRDGARARHVALAVEGEGRAAVRVDRLSTSRPAMPRSIPSVDRPHASPGRTLAWSIAPSAPFAGKGGGALVKKLGCR